MNIIIDKVGLDNLIVKLEHDNKKIVEIAKDINKSIKFLNDKWISSEKEKLDLVLNKDMDKIDNTLLLYLNECTNLLRNANRLYEQKDMSLTSEVDIL